MSETLRVVLCVGQVRVLTCVLVSFCVTGETERGRESALRCHAYAHTREGGRGGGGKHKRETPAPTHVQSLVSRALVLCTVVQVRVLTCVLVSFCVTGETERGRESAR